MCRTDGFVFGIGILAAIAAVVTLGGGCEKELTDAEREKLLAAMDSFASPPPPEYPAGIPTFPGLRGVNMLGVSGVGTLQASSTSPPEELTEHYVKAFEAAGWAFDEEESDIDGENLHCYRDPTGRMMGSFLITYDRRSRTTTLTIICGPMGSFSE